MKKLLAMSLCVILALTMVACGNGNSGSDNGKSDELSGSWLDKDTSTVLLTFGDNKVTYTLLAAGSGIDGTYETADGNITLRFDESTPMPTGSVPYTVEDEELIIDGTVYIKQSGGIPGDGNTPSGGDIGGGGGGGGSSGAPGSGGIGAGSGTPGDGSISSGGDIIGSNGGELSGTYLEETGTVSLTFSGDTVILDFPTDDYTVEGTFETADGTLTFHFDEFTPMADGPVPYEIQDGNLILDGTAYIKQ
ncbi:MAG: hypothetical protein LBV27_09335 [Oscillospiraceae bacterium]|nr:hypothetical protein [Oscillospiraceae bacterium]